MKFRFLIAGIISTVVAFFTFPIIFRYFLADYFSIAFVLAQTINITLSFMLQKIFVFKIAGWSNIILMKFFFNAINLQIIAYTLLFFLVNILNINVIYANIFVTLVISICSFFLHKASTFK